jgi:hypothetical protein
MNGSFEWQTSSEDTPNANLGGGRVVTWAYS